MLFNFEDNFLNESTAKTIMWVGVKLLQQSDASSTLAVLMLLYSGYLGDILRAVSRVSQTLVDSINISDHCTKLVGKLSGDRDGVKKTEKKFNIGVKWVLKHCFQ